MSDAVKAVVILIGYVGVGPILGLLASRSRTAQRWLFGLLVFMTSWHVNKLTLMLNSIEWYRGHTKGFEFSLLEVVAIALLVACAIQRQQPWRWLAPGTFLYLGFVALSMISVFAAPEKMYVAMVALKFAKLALVYLATFHFLRDESDLRALLNALAITLCIQALVVLKMKYLDHVYQAWGWFEHQNSLAMWAYMCGLPLLSAAMAQARTRSTLLYLAGFAAAALIVLASLSRGALAVFSAGVVLVVLLTLVERFTIKRTMVAAVVIGFAVLTALVSLPTLVTRFQEERNEASAQYRRVLNQAARAMLRDSAVGHGWNNFVVVINRPFHYGEVLDNWQRSRGYTIDESDVKPATESHYWLMLAETGYPGLLGYMLFIVVTAYWCARNAWVYRRTIAGALLIGIFAALVLTYAHSTLERVLTQTKNIAMWLIVLGVVARAEAWRRIGSSPGLR